LPPVAGAEQADMSHDVTALAADPGHVYAVTADGELQVLATNDAGSLRHLGALEVAPADAAGLPAGTEPGIGRISDSLYIAVGLSRDVSPARQSEPNAGQVVAVDVSDAARPRITDRFDVAGRIEAVAVSSGALALVLEHEKESDHTAVWLVSPAPGMKRLGRLSLGNGSVTGAVADTDHLYVIGFDYFGSEGRFALLTLDTSDPSAPRETSRRDLPQPLDIPLVSGELCSSALRAWQRDPARERRP